MKQFILKPPITKGGEASIIDTSTGRIAKRGIQVLKPIEDKFNRMMPSSELLIFCYLENTDIKEIDNFLNHL